MAKKIKVKNNPDCVSLQPGSFLKELPIFSHTLLALGLGEKDIMQQKEVSVWQKQ